jgi:arylsulfatase A-like enzyme
VVRLPNGQRGLEVKQPVSLIDLYPTFVDYCNLKGDHKFNEKGAELGGNSLRPLLENKDWKGPKGALTIVGNVGNKTTVDTQNFSYRTENFRYIRYAKGQEELYDHKTDPYEWYNLAAEKDFRKIKRKLSKQMQTLINKHR